MESLVVFLVLLFGIVKLADFLEKLEKRRKALLLSQNDRNSNMTSE